MYNLHSVKLILQHFYYYKGITGCNKNSVDPDQILLQKPSDLDPHHFQKAKCPVLMHAWLVKHAACLGKLAKRFQIHALSVRNAICLPKHPKRFQMHACARLAS